MDDACAVRRRDTGWLMREWRAFAGYRAILLRHGPGKTKIHAGSGEDGRWGISMADRDKKGQMKYAGAFIAWVIGSGLQIRAGILQSSSYGYYSYGVVVLNLVGFLFLGNMLMTTGYAHKKISMDLTILPIIAKKGGNLLSMAVLGTWLLIAVRRLCGRRHRLSIMG